VVAVALVVLNVSAASAAVVNVCPTGETAPVHSSGDAADDSAIWIHPTDPSLSTLIGTDKTATGGLIVYGLSGTELSVKADGRFNNDDVRYNFPLGSSRVSLVGATNRVAKTLDFYKVNEPDRSLTRVGSVPVTAAIVTPRGFALYRSAVSGKYYAFVTDLGKTEQYELSGASGQVTGTLVRTMARISNPTEGLVADDGLGRLYIAEEKIGGVWRFGAEPTDPTTGSRFVTTTELGGPIKQSVEGLTIYYASNGGGYLIAASQGAGSFHIFNRGDNAYIGEFKIVACNGIDAVTGQDGIEVTNVNLGPLFPQGIFASQDHANDGANQNHKLVPWQSIANAFNPPLTIDPSFDPRTIGAPSGPDTTILSGPSGSVSDTSATFTFASSELGSTFACKLDAADFAACNSGIAYGPLADGLHTFQVQAINAAGQVDPTPATRSWAVDTTPPDTMITSGPTNTTSTSASFSFASTESGGEFACSLDAAPFAPCTSPTGYSALAGGSHNFLVRATDAAGNVDPTPATSAWQVTIVADTTPPTVSLTAPPDLATGVAVGANVQATFSEEMDPITVTNVTFTLTTGQVVPLLAVVSYDAAAKAATLNPSSDLATATSYTATVTVGAKDVAGNPLAVSKVWSFTTAAAPPPSGGIRRESVSTIVNATAIGVATLAKPAGTVAGDVLVACLVLNGGSVSSTGVPAGWTRIAAVTAIANPHVFGYYKVAGSLEPASYGWTLAGSVANGAGIARYSGVSNASPLDATVSVATGASSSSGVVAGVTTGTANAMLVGCMAINSLNTAVTIASPVGMGQAWDVGGKRHELADGVQSAAGGSGAKAWTFSAGREWAGWLTALRPQ